MRSFTPENKICWNNPKQSKQHQHFHNQNKANSSPLKTRLIGVFFFFTLWVVGKVLKPTEADGGKTYKQIKEPRMQLTLNEFANAKWLQKCKEKNNKK